MPILTGPLSLSERVERTPNGERSRRCRTVLTVKTILRDKRRRFAHERRGIAEPPGDFFEHSRFERGVATGRNPTARRRPFADRLRQLRKIVDVNFVETDGRAHRVLQILNFVINGKVNQVARGVWDDSNGRGTANRLKGREPSVVASRRILAPRFQNAGGDRRVSVDSAFRARRKPFAVFRLPFENSNRRLKSNFEIIIDDVDDRVPKVFRRARLHEERVRRGFVRRSDGKIGRRFGRNACATGKMRTCGKGGGENANGESARPAEEWRRNKR